MEFAKRMQRVKESETFRYAALAKKKGMIDLTVGRTNFDTPDILKDAAKRAMDSGKNHYTASKGVFELREMIVDKLRRKNKISTTSENVIVSTGAKQIVFEAIMALIDKGDVVAIPDPSWVSYEQIVNIANGKIIHPPLNFKNEFIPGEEFFTYLENKKFKMIILNSPNNPTGAVYPEETLRRIVDIAEKKDAWIISDEIYERVIYEGTHFSPGSIYEKCITIDGFSKEASMTGWRLGYGSCKIQEVIEKMDIIQQQTVSCAPSVLQYAVIDAFSEEVRTMFKEKVKELRIRRDLIIEKLEKISEVTTPGGAFYVFPHFKSNDIKLTKKLLNNGVGVTPGSSFGSQGRGYIRISYGVASLNELEKAMGIIERVVG